MAKRQTVYTGRLERLEQAPASATQYATVSDQLTTRDHGTLREVFEAALREAHREEYVHWAARVRKLAARLGVEPKEDR